LINVPLAALVVAVALRHVPESRDPDAARRLDISGVLTGAAGLAGLTYGFTAWPALGGTSPAVLAALAVGLGGMVGFVFAERRSPHPMVPLEVFASRAFTAANLVTFAVYAALGGMFFLVVLNLQVVAHFTPLAAGIALLPITALLLLLSARAGALAQRIGPRIPMTLGPVICAGALVLFARIGANTSYIRDVLPAAVTLGLGLSLTVAPLTATALGSVDERHAGVASGSTTRSPARPACLPSRSCPWPQASAPAASPTQPPSLRPTEPPCCCALAFSWSAPPSPSPLFLPSSQARTSPSRPPGRCGSTAPSPALHSNPAPRRLPFSPIGRHALTVSYPRPLRQAGSARPQT
jgi:hypothetical protein